MPKWLVTGGCGFIGSHLATALLARGDDVCVLDDLSSGKRENLPPRASLLIGDIADPKMVIQALDGVDGCFHLAAIASVQRCTEDWAACQRTNLTGTVTVFEQASKAANAPIPVIYASSAAVYGDNPDAPLAETALTVPLSAYGADKLSCEFQGRVAWRVHGVPNIGLRFFNVYGPRQDPSSPYSGVIAIFAGRLAKGQEIKIFGDGQQLRDFVYVGDVVAHLLAAMWHCQGGRGIYNICTGRAVSILELAKTLGDIAGEVPVIRHEPPRPGDIKVSIGNPEAAKKAFDLSARTSLSDGLRLTLSDLRPDVTGR